MIAVTIVAIVMFIARLGYWPCIAASIVMGSLVLATIPAIISGSPRFVFAIVGAVGAVCGWWLGSRFYFASNVQPTEWLTRMEYEKLFWSHLVFSIMVVLCASIAGSIIGVGVCNVAGRNSITR